MQSLKFALYLVLFFILSSAQGADEDAQFSEKLGTMLERTDKSLKILREQIVQNQSAPFLADLYLQLGDMLSQKSTTLYYLQMERENRTDDKTAATKKFSPVVVAQKEAIAIYQQILREFPKFDKIDRVLYRLAVSQKSIDEGAAFVQTAERLIKEFPKAKEAFQVRLLLGQYFYDMQGYDEALRLLQPVKDSAHVYERNVARYRMGLILINQEKHAEALKNFEAVALDETFKEDINPLELSLQTKSTKTNLKREALIDSVRAYTEVYRYNPDPVTYYSHIAPTAQLFQETIEKLAFRYIFLRQYQSAIKLLRVLSERIADPQKVMNIYQQVLVMIPIQERLDVPVSEMQFVLEKYNDWSTHYALSAKIKTEAQDFFEKQIRELGTRSHDLAKQQKDSSKKAHYFERARQYYHLYLGFYESGPRTVKIATNLADVYYNQHNYFQAGSYYLRTYSGEFGQPVNKADLLANAILALQKPADYDFYEQVRVKGLFVKAARLLLQADPKKRNDPSINFALAKTYYEQGFYKRALGDLHNFLKRFPASKQASDAADLILSYYNTRSDFKGLVESSSKMLQLNLPDKTLNARLADVKSKALLRQLEERVKTQKGYDVLAQGRSYLQTALSIQDTSLRSEALKQALGRSKEERDIETFLKTARTMTSTEKNSTKRLEILTAMADETLAISRFNQALTILKPVIESPEYPQKARVEALEKSIKISAMLRDYERLFQFLNHRLVNEVNVDTRSSSEQQLMDALKAGQIPSPALAKFLLNKANSPEKLEILYQTQSLFPKALASEIKSRIAKTCTASATHPLCKSSRWPEAVQKITSFVNDTKAQTPSMESIEGVAGRLAGLLDFIKQYEGSQNAQLDILLSLASRDIYTAFADFLNRAAKANPDFAQVLQAKANESLGSASRSEKECASVVEAASLESSACGLKRLPASVPTAKLKGYQAQAVANTDPVTPAILELQKSLFAKRTDYNDYYRLGEFYLSGRNWNHAAAVAVLGRAAFPQAESDFLGILGCSLINLNLKSEAKFHLEKASDTNGHKTECLAQVRSRGAL